MKKIIIYCILLMLFGFATAYSQATKSKTTQDAQAAKSLEDQKLSPEEQALLLTAGEDNPAKIDESTMVDPKMDPESMATEEDYGISNAKPIEGQEFDSKREVELTRQEKQSAPDPVVKPNSGTGQPAGEKSGTITDYRNMKAEGNDQPAGDKPESITNYRDIKGSADQPPGDAPIK